MTMTLTHEVAGMVQENNLVHSFTDVNGDYYEHEFKKIGDRTGFTPSFNSMAALFGSIWFGSRNLWNWFLALIVFETFVG